MNKTAEAIVADYILTKVKEHPDFSPGISPERVKDTFLQVADFSIVEFEHALAGFDRNQKGRYHLLDKMLKELEDR